MLFNVFDTILCFRFYQDFGILDSIGAGNVYACSGKARPAPRFEREVPS